MWRCTVICPKMHSGLRELLVCNLDHGPCVMFCLSCVLSCKPWAWPIPSSSSSSTGASDLVLEAKMWLLTLQGWWKRELGTGHCGLEERAWAMPNAHMALGQDHPLLCRDILENLSSWFLGLVFVLFFWGGVVCENELGNKTGSCGAHWAHPVCLGRAPLVTTFKEGYCTCFWTISIVGHKEFLTLCQKSTHRASSAPKAIGCNNARGGISDRSWKGFMKCIMVDCLKLLELIFNSCTL